MNLQAGEPDQKRLLSPVVRQQRTVSFLSVSVVETASAGCRRDSFTTIGNFRSSVQSPKPVGNLSYTRPGFSLFAHKRTPRPNKGRGV